MRRTRTKARRQTGISIVEVVVAAALLLLAVVPILKALTTGQVTARIADQTTQSLALAQSKMSDIQARADYSFTSSCDESGTSLKASYLCNVSDDEHATLKTVSVSVGYDQDGNGSLASDEVLVTLTTLIAKRS